MRHRLIREVKDALIVIGVILLVVLVVVSGINIFVVAYASNNIVEAEAITTVSGYNCVLVSDSSIWSAKTRDLLLNDRLNSAYDIYSSGYANALLISGKSLDDQPDESDTLYQEALRLGFPPESIITDYESATPVNTAERAIGELEIKSMIIVSQRMLLYRSVYDARRAGLNIIGIKTQQPEIRYGIEVWSNFREFFKRAHDFIAIEIFRVMD